MEARVGDTVDVPGGMYGTVKFVGEVAGKKGKFAGVQLALEYATRGKNSGDVDGKYYFRTTKPGAGIFLPVEKATRRGPATPLAPSLVNFNQGGRTPVLPKPNFSQSIGPGARAASPALKPAGRRPSLPRYDSPVRKTPALKNAPNFPTPASRPSFGPGSKSKVGTSSRYGQSPMGRTGNFGASLRGPSVTPSRTPLGPESSFDEDSESTPTPTPSAVKSIDHTMKDEELKRLKSNLEEKDKRLKEQAATLSDMEKSLAELQSLLPADSDSLDSRRDSGAVSEDVVHMRSIVREKNEKIQMLIAEFDAHRADFRSTIDTLEMASTETERVYERRVEDLTQEVHDLQVRCEDVDTVAQQFKQLEDLVQELEEGLEDARRGEAEARGEVEFLRGEVERGRSELRKEKTRATSNAGSRDEYNDNGSTRSSGARELDAKDDEIRGLKAIIHSLSGTGPPSAASAVNDHLHGTASGQSMHEEPPSDERGQRLHELEVLLDEKTSREQELERELERLRTTTQHAPTSSSLPENQKSRPSTMGSGGRLSDRTIVPGNSSGGSGEQQQQQQQQHDVLTSAQQSRLDTMHEAEAGSTVTDNSAAGAGLLWCEICETTGHDILTCGNMFANGTNSEQGQPKKPDEEPRTTANAATSVTSINTSKNYNNDNTNTSPLPLRTSSASQQQQQANNTTTPSAPAAATTTSSPSPPAAALAPGASTTATTKSPANNPTDLGMVAGKSSGVIDADRWCALCERDGHESVDCPFEDAF